MNIYAKIKYSPNIIKLIGLYCKLKFIKYYFSKKKIKSLKILFTFWVKEEIFKRFICFINVIDISKLNYNISVFFVSDIRLKLNT